MTNRHLRIEFIGCFAAGVLTILLASVIVALAHAPQTRRHHSHPTVKIQQTHHRLVHAAARKTISHSRQGYRCRAGISHCGVHANRIAAQMVICRSARHGRPAACGRTASGVKKPLHAARTKPTRQAVRHVTQNKLAAETLAPSAQTASGQAPKIDADNIALLRAVR